MAYASQFSNMNMSPVSLPRSNQSSPSNHRKRSKKNRALKATDGLFDDPTNSIATVGVDLVDLVDPADYDATLVNALVDAMADMSATEDNPGMLETWRKLMSVKALKVQRVCEDLLATVKRSHAQNGVPLGERKPVNLYPSFETRFEAVCETLRTQKTVCKHLMEDPYSYQVVDDPLQALRRVQNNRRVNQQKKEVIDKGRQYMGEKAQGKGRPNIKIDTEEDASLADETVGSDSPIIVDLDSVSEFATPVSKRESPRKRSAKRMRPTESDSDEVKDEQKDQPASVRSIKRRKRSSKSKEALQSLLPSSNNSALSALDIQSTYSSPSNFQSLYSSPNNATLEDPFAIYDSSLVGPQMNSGYSNFNQPQGSYFNQLPYGDMLGTQSGFTPNTFGQQTFANGLLSDQNMGYNLNNGSLPDQNLGYNLNNGSFADQNLGYNPNNGQLLLDQPLDSQPFDSQPFDSSHLLNNQLDDFHYPLPHTTPP